MQKYVTNLEKDEKTLEEKIKKFKKCETCLYGRI